MKKLLIVLLLFSPMYTHSQGWSFEYSAGYGTYQLNDIRLMQRSMLNTLHYNYGLKETESFPNYFTHSVALGFDTGNHHVGRAFSYFTTGGRLHRADYSGSYTVDIIMNAYRFGLFYRRYVETDYPSLKIFIQFGSGTVLSELKMKEQLIVYSESDQVTHRLSGIGVYLEPMIGAKYRFSNLLHFSLVGGYEFDFLGSLIDKGRKTQLKAHWNGFRVNAGLSVIIPNFN